ncbi:hypothetical protein SERMPA_00099 (plasmid) [Serratia marcescens]|nr:Uncharacterised protein [Serratia marcescens]
MRGCKQHMNQFKGWQFQRDIILWAVRLSCSNAKVDARLMVRKLNRPFLS